MEIRVLPPAGMLGKGSLVILQLTILALLSLICMLCLLLPYFQPFEAFFLQSRSSVMTTHPWQYCSSVEREVFHLIH